MDIDFGKSKDQVSNGKISVTLMLESIMQFQSMAVGGTKVSLLGLEELLIMSGETKEFKLNLKTEKKC